MVSRGHPWSSGRAPSWDCHPWSSGRGAMVVIAYFMGGAAWLGGFHFLSARCSCPVPAIEVATSPARDGTHSKSCVVRGLGVLRGSTSLYLPPGVRFLTLPTRFDRIDHASLSEYASLESRCPLWTSSSDFNVTSSLVGTIARKYCGGRVRSVSRLCASGLVGVGGPAWRRGSCFQT